MVSCDIWIRSADNAKKSKQYSNLPTHSPYIADSIYMFILQRNSCYQIQIQFWSVICTSLYVNMDHLYYRLQSYLMTRQQAILWVDYRRQCRLDTFADHYGYFFYVFKKLPDFRYHYGYFLYAFKKLPLWVRRVERSRLSCIKINHISIIWGK